MPLLKKVRKALRSSPVIPFVSFEHAVQQLEIAKELTSEDVAALLSYNEKRKLAVRVDEFTFDLELIDANGEKVVVDITDAA